ncbi:MAG: glutamate racemase [Gammaproteobacteria bacterium]|nr:glutamate racemase [Gammaproteobacteria bacterium]
MSHILILDSGIGGLTVWQEIQKLLPKVSCDYVADNAYFPYGTKSDVELEQRLEILIERFVEKLQQEFSADYSAIVIACNSASTVVLDFLRAKFEIPIVGVVPAIKPAASLTLSKKIGLLATEGTVNGVYTDKLISDFASDCTVIKVASQKLVSLAESRMKNQSVSHQDLLTIVSPFVDKQVDVVVLGCTHFPWFKSDLEQLCPSIKWIDSGSAIAKRIGSLISNEKYSKLESGFYFTGEKYPNTVNINFARVSFFNI